MEDILRAVEKTRGPHVGFIGDASRTRYVDEDTVFDVLDMLCSTKSFTAVHGGAPPFDKMVERICQSIGVPTRFVGDGKPRDYRSRFKPYQRPAELLDGLCGLIVFPSEGSSVHEVDDLVQLAWEAEIPIVGISRKGAVLK